MSTRALDKPPSSDIEASTQHLPPSPPLSPEPRTTRKQRSTVARLLETIQLLKALKYDVGGDWVEFDLSPAEYSEFQSRLEEDSALLSFCSDKVRFDWDAPRSRYVLRLPSATHERFVSRVDDAVAAGISSLVAELDGEDAATRVEGTAVPDELRKVHTGRSTTLELCVPQLDNSSQESAEEDAKAREVRRSPDASFYHSSRPHLPCLVIEVSYSQQRKDLPRLAESYIIDSRHAINCVIGLDIPYPDRSKQGRAAFAARDKSATVSVWRPAVEKDDNMDDVGICQIDVDAVHFRDKHGVPCDGQLAISVSDLLPSEVAAAVPAPLKERHFAIPFASLATFLASAEHLPSVTPPAPPSGPKRFRKRKRSPSETLSEAREADYAREELTAVIRDQELDDAYRGQGQRRIDGQSGSIQLVERRRSTRRKASGRSIGADS